MPDWPRPAKTTEAQALFPKRERFRRFARLLDETFCLRSELRSLPSADTLICRCEDVSYSRLREHTSWRAAKLHTRCGMGPCQGRICGPATQFLFKWNPDSVRPPVFPARVEHLAAAAAVDPRSDRRRPMNWKGVMPAITTSFNENLSVDHGFLTEHCPLAAGERLRRRGRPRLARRGRDAVVRREDREFFAPAETQSMAAERSSPRSRLSRLLSPCRWRKPQRPGLFRADGVAAVCVSRRLARDEDSRRGCVPSDASLLHALQQSGCIRNRFPPGADTGTRRRSSRTSEAVKESSTDARRVSAIRALVDDRIEISVGVDDAVLEAIGVGATGWVAGLANALAARVRRSVQLRNPGRDRKAFELYRWFLPLLRMDTVPKFVQLIKAGAS